jgi:hypothetical protein
MSSETEQAGQTMLFETDDIVYWHRIFLLILSPETESLLSSETENYMRRSEKGREVSSETEWSIKLVLFEADDTVYWRRFLPSLLSPETDNIVVW